MSTISDGTTAITPELITGYASSRTANNVVHEIVGRPAPEVTLRAAGLRTGNLEALLTTQADALALEALLSLAKVLTLADVDVPGVDMAFVSVGDITVTLEDSTRAAWLVGFDFQEVTP